MKIARAKTEEEEEEDEEDSGSDDQGGSRGPSPAPLLNRVAEEREVGKEGK